jgi:deazaflavin-dependent oxidoreductase (nitroreductase family)
MTSEPGSSPDHPIDNAADWVAAHIRALDEQRDTEPATHRGAPLLLLTTKGAKSGVWRRTALIYGEDDGRYLIVASKGGHPQPPAWYLNLTANPRVRIQAEDRAFYAVARTATPEEKPALWDRMVGIWPDYANYQTKTDRDIPVVILEPLD